MQTCQNWLVPPATSQPHSPDTVTLSARQRPSLHASGWPVLSQFAAERYSRLAEHFTRLARSNSASHRAEDADGFRLTSTKCPALDEPILEALMIPLAMIVIDEFLEGPSDMALPERHDPIEALVFDRPHKSFGIGVRIGRLKRCKDVPIW